MSLRRAIIRLRDADREALSRLGARFQTESRRRLSRAALVRLLVGHGLSALDESRPIAEQLPLHLLDGERQQSPKAPPREGASLRERIVQMLGARPEEVFTPAKVAALVGARTRDCARNTLLALASQRRIEKVGPGQYRARRDAGGAAARGGLDGE